MHGHVYNYVRYLLRLSLANCNFHNTPYFPNLFQHFPTDSMNQTVLVYIECYPPFICITVIYVIAKHHNQAFSTHLLILDYHHGNSYIYSPQSVIRFKWIQSE